MKLQYSKVGIIGTGAMGRGIAQIAAQAGSQVILFDTNTQAAVTAQTQLQAQWQSLVKKQRISEADAHTYFERLSLGSQLADLSDCDLIVEAIVERLDVKTKLFGELEDVVSTSTVLASNTSSLSITAIAARLFIFSTPFHS
jgi:3-hydroxybutyryl-CoA dehydrogenase